MLGGSTLRGRDTDDLELFHENHQEVKRPKNSCRGRSEETGEEGQEAAGDTQIDMYERHHSHEGLDRNIYRTCTSLF